MTDQDPSTTWNDDMIARIAELEAALTEARLASLAHLGQAADALEAQKKAEAERDALKTKLPRDFLEAK